MTPATAVDHLLIGKDGSANGAPIDEGLFAIGEVFLPHAQKKPLVPAVVFGLAGGDFAVPIVSQSEPHQLLLHMRDIGVGPVGGMALVLDGGVFGGQAKGVHPWVEHIVALHPLIAGEGVADGVVADVAHVQPAARIGQHLEDVVAGLGTVVEGPVEIGRRTPLFTPLQFDFLMVVRLFRHSDFRVSTLRRSSPGWSMGVSRMKALARSLG